MTLTEMAVEIRALIKKYAPEGTTFAWDRATSRFGCCSYKRNRLTGEYFGFRITISRQLALRNTWDVVKLTVLHEIAHSRTPGHNHDRVWQRECIRIGGDGKRCYRNTEQGGAVISIPKKYTGTCPRCGMTVQRDRRCNGYHCDRFSPIVWKLNKLAV